MGQPPHDHVCVTNRRSDEAAADRVAVRLGLRKRAELLELIRPAFGRTGPWLQAGKYVAAVMSDLPRRNGWTIARFAGDRSPDRTQRLLNGRPGTRWQRWPRCGGSRWRGLTRRQGGGRGRRPRAAGRSG